MAPEQAAGSRVDARADVFSAGVVLAEMVNPEGIKRLESRKSVWEGVRSQPARLPDSPWGHVLMKAVAREPEQRYDSVHTLMRALEEVTLRVEGAEYLHPYPGLESFTEDDAEYFFGREAQVETMWAKLHAPARLLAIAGPSGAGKTSFLRAGLIPKAPVGWAVARCTPGTAPLQSIRDTLISGISGKFDAMRESVLVRELGRVVNAGARWRRRHDQAVLIVDQFEELFTLSPKDIQYRVAALLRRLVLKADIFVVLSVRDDFLFRCHQSDPLRPALSELTIIGPPEGTDLRRALVQPATRCGYRFEDDDLVEEILAEVEGERGALPLVAFAMARLWEKRDRDNGLLTRQAYHDIGGVDGALARHAEETIDRIGSERLSVVRQLFRNLVTPEGTRAVPELRELLTVFEDSQREAAEEVLRSLIDSRLITSYKTHEEGREPTKRVEIIHESLLANWPRLVRWRTQDADSAQLRYQLRQAARTWQERGRSDDLLWTGSAYREFASWRERYAGGLTEVEEAFAEAMTSHARRRTRRRRLVVAATFLIAVVAAAVFAGLWRRSVRETRRAEAQKLLALGQLKLESYPSAAVAHAIASLESADIQAARHLALDALWKGPTALVVDEREVEEAWYAAGGDWIVQSVERPGELNIIGKNGVVTTIDRPESGSGSKVWINPRGDALCAVYYSSSPTPQSHLVLRSIPEGLKLADIRYDTRRHFFRIGWDDDRALVLLVQDDPLEVTIDAIYFDGIIRHLGSPDFGFGDAIEWGRGTQFCGESARWLGAVADGTVSVTEIGEHGFSEPRILGRHEGTGLVAAYRSSGDISGTTSDLALLVTADFGGTIKLWDPKGVAPPRTIHSEQGLRGLVLSGDGSRLAKASLEEGRIIGSVWSIEAEAPKLLRQIDSGPRGPGVVTFSGDGSRFAKSGPDRVSRLWLLDGPEAAEPISLLGRDHLGFGSITFDPSGELLLVADPAGLTLWPLERRLPAVIRGHDEAVKAVVFDPQGQWIASGSADDTVRLWPLQGEVPEAGRLVADAGNAVAALSVSPDSSRLLIGKEGPGSGSGGSSSCVEVVTLDEDAVRTDLFAAPGGRPGSTFNYVPVVAFSANGRVAAGIASEVLNGPFALYLWEEGSWEEPVVLEPEPQVVPAAVRVLDDGRILSAGTTGLWTTGPSHVKHELLHKGSIGRFAASDDGLRIALVETSEPIDPRLPGRAVLLDLGTGTAIPLDNHGDQVYAIAMDPSGTLVVTGSDDGVIRVGPATGEEPHLLFGHEGRVWSLALDPLGRWIASGGEDTTVRLWPMPDLSKPPLHTLPREELIAKLKTLTNLRVVRDEASATGWKLTHDPFPGWETVPSW